MRKNSKSPAAVYLDPDRPIPERVADLLGRLTLQEKLGQFIHPVEAVPRLGIPAYNFWSEGLHGVARNGRATVFPQAIGMAASWDRDLVQRVASAIGDEARAKHHAVVRRKGASGAYQGLTFWSPNVNIFRDPRWGRGQETWGEDPFLTGELGSAFVRGMQGDDPRYLKVAACAKHFAVHSGPEGKRHVFNARVSKRDLYATYLPAFKKLVTEAKVEAVMGAYNRVLDEPCCASRLLLQDILRGEWGFSGHVTSDCWALTNIHKDHNVTAGPVETAALALKAGCDISCGCTYDHLGEALEQGLIGEADIDRALGRTLATRFKLGMFDPPDMVPYAATPLSVVGCAKHRRLAHEAALKSVVLLKNKGGVLPLKAEVNSLFVTGPAAGSLDALLGNYHGINSGLVTLMEGIAGRTPEGVRVAYRPGCQWTDPSLTPINWAVFEAAESDVTIVCAGTSPLMEGEEGDSILTAANGDRADIALPEVQKKFISEICARGTRVILVLTGGSPIALGEIEEMVEAIVFVWYPGQEGGRAVAEVLFGDAVPSGKLPLTFPKSLAGLPPFEEYDMAGRTYRFASAEPLYPFGFGLSYTTFTYSGLDLKPATVRAGKALSASLTVANTGEVAGEEVVQFYLRDLEASVAVPLQQLIGFQRVFLKSGEKKVVELTVTPEMMMLVDDEGRQKLEPGRFRLTAGGCSPSERGLALGAPQPVSAEFTVSAG
jgi:beta-glucosidase